MNNGKLERRLATLRSVRTDLPAVWHELTLDTPVDRLPIVAVDWSELFGYATYTPAHEEDSRELFAAHYAGLDYLLNRMPCRLVLLPSYAFEMRNYLELMKSKALHSSGLGREDLVKRHDDLLKELEDTKKRYPEFAALLGGETAAVERLPEEAWSVIEDLLDEKLPSVFLDLQYSTLSAIGVIKRLVGERLIPLDRIDPSFERNCRRSLDSWNHWLGEMSIQRPSQERQNRADALALAYLAALHQVLRWKSRPVFFATRSIHMLSVMEAHRGEFLCGAARDGEIEGSISSSWRSWDYFAELGYYSEQHDSLEEALSELRQREAKIEQQLVRSSDPERRLQFKDTFTYWEGLRGSYDLAGVGEQHHWKDIVDPSARRLVELTTSLLAADKDTTFLERRGQLAEKILEDIEGILSSMPPEDVAFLQRQQRDERRIGVLVSFVTVHLDLVTDIFAYLGGHTKQTESSKLSSKLRAIVADLIKSSDTQHRRHSGNELLSLLASEEAKTSFEQEAIDWLTGTALFYCGLNKESLRWLTPWLETSSSDRTLAFDLFTRGICVEAYSHRRDVESGIHCLVGFDVANTHKPFTESEKLVYYCMLGQYLIDWIEPCKEKFEVFPRLSSGRGEEVVVGPIVDAVAGAIGRDLSSKLLTDASRIALYACARYIPENCRDLIRGNPDPPSLRWYNARTANIGTIESLLVDLEKKFPSAAVSHTLGYFNWKKFLLMKKQGRRGTIALDHFESARKLAEQEGDKRIKRLLAEHTSFAAESLNEGVD